MTNLQPDWAGAPPWAQWWAVDSDGYAYWYRNRPTFDDKDGYAYWYCNRPTYNAKYGGWLRTLGEDPDVSFDHCWPEREFNNWDIDWSQTLRSRP